MCRGHMHLTPFGTPHPTILRVNYFFFLPFVFFLPCLGVLARLDFFEEAVPGLLAAAAAMAPAASGVIGNNAEPSASDMIEAPTGEGSPVPSGLKTGGLPHRPPCS